jgi:sterol desaturase/sphingolipid hydroxylase (fatty acid hydroxylase superfamily)
MADESVDRRQATSEAMRDELLARVPSWYTPYGHLAGTIGVGLATLALALYKLAPIRAIELVTIPMAFVFSNIVEWWAHKHVMHRRRRFMPVLYNRHTPEHHRVYRYGDMAIRSVREFRLVLIPAMGVLGIVLLSAPAAWLVGFLSTYNAGWLFLMTTALYVVLYELTHLCYHLPENSIVYRIRLLRTLREHHARHHVPSLMQNFNFNVTVPLGDLLFGTIAPSERVSAALAREASR